MTSSLVICMMLTFQVTYLSLNQYFAHILSLTVFGTIIFMWVHCHEYFWIYENFSGIVWFFAFFCTGSKNLFPKYLMFDCVWYSHFCRFWTTQPRSIFLVLVICDMSHVRISIYMEIVITWVSCECHVIVIDNQQRCWYTWCHSELSRGKQTRGARKPKPNLILSLPKQRT